MESPLAGAVELAPLTGNNHSGWLATLADGSRVAVKTTPGVPPDLFDTEAEGLTALRASGAVYAPRVVRVGADHLVLEALEPAPGPDATAFWARAGRELARLHSVPGPRFGWHRDNWCGVVRQVNTWTEDCYEFFARHRILRYLPDPRVEAALDAAERAAIERICARLPDLVPPPPHPALTHGDLWHGNVMATPDTGRPALIDPAVSWSWPAVDVGMMLWCDGAGVPDAFFAAYHELLPPEPGWRAHTELLHLRELLSLLAHGVDGAVLSAVRDLIRRYG